MKRLTCAVAALLLMLAAVAASGALAGSTAGADRTNGGGHSYGFERFLQRYGCAPEETPAG